jgi:hypothetical protein
MEDRPRPSVRTRSHYALNRNGPGIKSKQV